MADEAEPAAQVVVGPVAWREAVVVWLRVAALSFGGPAGQIAVMQRILVEEKRWISPERFLHALQYCMLLPGPEAQQLATYIGWLLHRVRGGLVAGCLFVAPGFLAILGASLVYVWWGSTWWVGGLLAGLGPAVLVVVVDALVRLGRRAQLDRPRWLIAFGAFLALLVFQVPFPLILVVAAILGWWLSRGTVPPAVVVDAHNRPTLARTAAVAGLWLAVWWVPVFALWTWLGRDHVLVSQGLFFSQTAVVTFGGAYAVLAYIAQRAVVDFGWLSRAEMLDGLGLAETTPGPLIQVVQFVAFLGAFRNPGSFSPVVAGLLGSVVATWVTYAPCFLWIFLGAPYVEWLRGRRHLTAALAGISAAVVGVIANLAVWFGLHVLFDRVGERELAGFLVEVPIWSSVDVAALGLCGLAAVVLWRLRWGLLPTLGIGALGGLLVGWVG